MNASPAPRRLGRSALAVLAGIVAIFALGCYLAARLAPDRPMGHALALGVVGLVLSALGAAASWNAGLGPRWYPILLVASSLPCAWAGGKLQGLGSSGRPRPA